MGEGEERRYSLFAPKSSAKVLAVKSDQLPHILTALNIFQQLEGLQGESTATFCHGQEDAQ